MLFLQIWRHLHSLTRVCLCTQSVKIIIILNHIHIRGGSNRFPETTSQKHTFLSRTLQTEVDRLSHVSGCLHLSCRRILTEVSNTGCFCSVYLKKTCLKYPWWAELSLKCFIGPLRVIFAIHLTSVVSYWTSEKKGTLAGVDVSSWGENNDKPKYITKLMRSSRKIWNACLKHENI